MTNGHLYFIMGVSGSGKGTLRENLKNTPIDIEFIKSYVTREMRPGEVNGDVYHFIDLEEFQRGIHNHEFLEYEVNHKIAYYGTKYADVEEGLSKGKTLAKEVDTKGLKQIQDNYPELKKSFTSIFLDISDDIVRARFFERNPQGKIADIENRIESCQEERSTAQEICDYIIDASQSPDVVLEDVLKIINS